MTDRSKKPELKLAEDDPYASVVQEGDRGVEVQEKESARVRKWRQFQQKLDVAKGGIVQSFMMGALIGGGFGTVFGIWNAITHRTVMIIPIAAVTSGVSFGFFLACGSIIRMQPYNAMSYQMRYARYNLHTQSTEEEIAMWKVKYQTRGY
jgi:hypothetical protein